MTTATATTTTTRRNSTTRKRFTIYEFALLRVPSLELRSDLEAPYREPSQYKDHEEQWPCRSDGSNRLDFKIGDSPNFSSDALLSHDIFIEVKGEAAQATSPR